jgi:hypothetical protein
MYFSKTQCDTLYFMKHILMQFCFDIISSRQDNSEKHKGNLRFIIILLILYYFWAHSVRFNKCMVL